MPETEIERETEVYLLNPTIGKYYYTARFTRKHGRSPGESYYTYYRPTYMGKFIKAKNFYTGRGFAEGGIFEDETDKKTLYMYSETTAFIEVDMNNSLFLDFCRDTFHYNDYLQLMICGSWKLFIFIQKWRNIKIE